MAASPPPIFSLAESRWLPERRRRECQRDLVRFQIDEINGVYDGLTLSAGTDAHADRVARAQARIERMLQAARWLDKAFARELLAILREPLDEPEDAFGIAVLVLGLGLDSPAVRAWLSELAGPVRARLDELNLSRPVGDETP
jgi:hypothetical protein